MKALINTYECYFGDVATVYDGRRKLYTNALVPIDRDQVSRFLLTSIRFIH